MKVVLLEASQGWGSLNSGLGGPFGNESAVVLPPSFGMLGLPTKHRLPEAGVSALPPCLARAALLCKRNLAIALHRITSSAS